MAPFHVWVPEVYQNAPSLVILILLTIPKLTFIIFLTRLFYEYFYLYNNYINSIIFITIICSFLFGTLGAIYQIKLKKFLAYSAIANMDLY